MRDDLIVMDEHSHRAGPLGSVSYCAPPCPPSSNRPYMLAPPLDSSRPLTRARLVAANIAPSTWPSHCSGRPSVTTGAMRGRYSPAAWQETCKTCSQSGEGDCMCWVAAHMLSALAIPPQKNPQASKCGCAFMLHPWAPTIRAGDAHRLPAAAAVGAGRQHVQALDACDD